jgi:hypothetical protein
LQNELDEMKKNQNPHPKTRQIAGRLEHWGHFVNNRVGYPLAPAPLIYSPYWF